LFGNFGGPNQAFTPDCPNKVTLNCTEGNLLYELKASCKGKVVESGCALISDASPWTGLHPTVSLSKYFKPIWKTKDGNKWPEYGCGGTYENDTTVMCANTKPLTEIDPATMGIDGVWAFNHQNLFMFQIAFSFMGVGFMPNLLTRFMFAQSDLTVKKSSIVQVAVGGELQHRPF